MDSNYATATNVDEYLSLVPICNTINNECMQSRKTRSCSFQAAASFYTELYAGKRGTFLGKIIAKL